MGDRYEVGLIGAGIGASLSPALHERGGYRLAIMVFAIGLLGVTTTIVAVDQIGNLL